MITFDNVTKIFADGTTPVKDFSMHIEKGETVILKGESGSGKSTILSLTAALMRPTSGDITVNNKKIAKLPDDFASLFRRENIGIIFQSYHLLQHFTVMENICVPVLPTNIHYTDAEVKAMSLLSLLGMTDKVDTEVSVLSGGEQQRVAIARALINSPEIILADEPTANLDRKLTDGLIDIFRKLSAHGHTIIIATHDTAITESGIASKIIDIGRH